MKAMLYGIKVQLKIDIRSKTLLVTCYVVPLLFFAIMGGIFTSLMPEAKNTLIQSMTVMGVSMGAFIGVPPSMVEVYGTDIKKMYTFMFWCNYLSCICIYPFNDNEHDYFYTCTDCISLYYPVKYSVIFYNTCLICYCIACYFMCAGVSC